jgi:hypothetical protein
MHFSTETEMLSQDEGGFFVTLARGTIIRYLTPPPEDVTPWDAVGHPKLTLLWIGRLSLSVWHY